MTYFNDRQKKILRLARTSMGAPGNFKADIIALKHAGLIESKVSGLGGHQIRYFATEESMKIDASEISA